MSSDTHTQKRYWKDKRQANGEDKLKKFIMPKQHKEKRRGFLMRQMEEDLQF